MRRWVRLDRWDVAAFVVIVATVALYAREIGNAFLLGHDGGNGAPFSIAAENTIRFGVIGQAKEYTGLTTPPPHEVYTHHPLLLHLQLVIGRLLLGRAEWIGRLVPFAYSVATLPLLYRVGRRLWSAPFALAALTLYCLTPLHLIFATMINHEQGGIFWTLLAAYGAVLFLLEGRTRRLWLAIGGGTLAFQFAWASYFVLAVTGAVALAAWVRAPSESPLRRRARMLSLALLATAVVNLVAFFALIRFTKGSFGDMGAALAHRSSEVSGYGAALVRRALDLYGPAILGLTVAGLLRLVDRAREGRVRTRDALAISFLLGQVGLTLLFRNAGRIHSYWTYFGGVACALLGADALIGAARWIASRVRPATLAGIIASALVAQGTFAVRQQNWGLATGHAAYAKVLDDQFAEILVARWVNARYGRDVTYALHPSLNAREEVFYYLDAPRSVTPLRLAISSSPCPTRACVLLADLRRAADGVTRAELAARAHAHASFLFEDRWLVIDLTAPPSEPEGYALETRPATALHRWFVSARRPPASFRRIERVRALPVPELEIPSFVAESSKSGEPLGEPCRRGAALRGLALREHGGALVALRGLCSVDGHVEPTPWMGEEAHGIEREVSCDATDVIVGLRLSSASAPSSVAVECAPPHAPTTIFAAATSGYLLTCPNNAVAVSVHARRDRALTGVGIGCRER